MGVTPQQPQWPMTRPAAITIAWVAMVAAAVLTALAGPLTLAADWQDFRGEVERALSEDGTLEMLGLVLAVGVIFVVAISFGIAALWLVMAWLTGRGAEWSRVVGTLLFGLYVLVSICWLISVADPVPLIADLLTLPCGLVAVIAIWQRPATAWYRRPRP